MRMILQLVILELPEGVGAKKIFPIGLYFL